MSLLSLSSFSNVLSFPHLSAKQKIEGNQEGSASGVVSVDISKNILSKNTHESIGQPLSCRKVILGVFSGILYLIQQVASEGSAQNMTSTANGTTGEASESSESDIPWGGVIAGIAATGIVVAMICGVTCKKEVRNRSEKEKSQELAREKKQAKKDERQKKREGYTKVAAQGDSDRGTKLTNGSEGAVEVKSGNRGSSASGNDFTGKIKHLSVSDSDFTINVNSAGSEAVNNSAVFEGDPSTSTRVPTSLPNASSESVHYVDEN
ncbi:hypothetical protein [Endozoicomonas sp.]|uniref:hypothetical protein n=1 Tax=Endozoicomonas sp. TaxID=1892382 RepID=UPI0028881338|nr:hypothetical protein [Endozoicomonas sp.]